MTSPVDLSDLDLVTVADDNDLALIRKGNTTDYKIICANLRKINIPGLPVMTTSPTALDLLIVSQTGTNRQCNFGSIGLVNGTKLWFYASAAPNGVSPVFWKIVPNLGDRLLAVRNSTGEYTAGGGKGGDWQQQGVGGGMGALTLAMIPPHTHRIPLGKEVTDQDTSAEIFPRLAKHIAKTDFTSDARTASAGGSGTPPKTLTHNHGKDWRPLANVGVICEKVL